MGDDQISAVRALKGAGRSGIARPAPRQPRSQIIGVIAGQCDQWPGKWPIGRARQFRRQCCHHIGARIRDASNAQLRIGRGYDHNFIVDGKAGDMRTAAIVEDPVSGRVMEVRATAPGIQFYTGNFMDGTYFGKNNRAYRQGDALCLEPGTFPNAPNNPGFPSARLNPGQAYFNSMVFAFRTR